MDPSDFLVCDGCRRCFHERCCQLQGIKTAASKDGTWYHDADCKRVVEALQQQADRGPQPLGGGRSWRLIPLRARGGKERAAGGSGAGSRKHGLHALLDVLAPEYVSRVWMSCFQRT